MPDEEEEEKPRRERVKEVPVDPKKLSPNALIERSIALISDLKARELEELKDQTSHIDRVLGELRHLLGVTVGVFSS